MKPDHDRERVIICLETSVTGEPEQTTLKGEVRRVVQQALGLTVDDVLPLPTGVLPKTSSGKLQRAKTRELYEGGALIGRTAKGDASRLEVAKHAAASQLSYFRLAVLGGRKKKD
jgi:fatty-acyl-CoA synthase